MLGSLGPIVEASLYASLVAYAALAGATFLVNERGPAWRSWQISLIGGVVGSVGGIMVVRTLDGDAHMMTLGLALVASGRLLGAGGNMVLAVYLRGLIIHRDGEVQP